MTRSVVNPSKNNTHFHILSPTVYGIICHYVTTWALEQKPTAAFLPRSRLLGRLGVHIGARGTKVRLSRLFWRVIS